MMIATTDARLAAKRTYWDLAIEVVILIAYEISVLVNVIAGAREEDLLIEGFFSPTRRQLPDHSPAPALRDYENK